MKTQPPPGIPAKKTTACPLCPELIHAGDRIGFDLGQPAHCACVRELADDRTAS